MVIKVYLSYLAKAKKEKENKKKAELEAERLKQEQILKNEQAIKLEQARQKELSKPKTLLSTPQSVPVKSPLLPTPELTPRTLTTTTKPLSNAAKPLTSTPTLFGNLTKSPGANFGTPQITTSTAKIADTKSMGEKIQLPFGITGKPDPTNVAGSISSPGFSFGPKTESPIISSTKTPAFGIITQPKTDGLNSSKPTTQKTPLLPTPIINKEVSQPTASLTSNFNITPKSSAKISTPLLATPPNIQPQQNIPSSVTPASVSTTSSSFKFDLGNAFSTNTNAPTMADKPKNDKENIPITATIPITKTSSVGNFSFLSASSNPSTPLAKPSTTQSSITSVTPISSSISSPFSSVISTQASVATPSSTGFSFAKASAETSIPTAVSTTSVIQQTSTTSSSTDPSSVFQGFNICKPNVADSATCKKLNIFFS